MYITIIIFYLYLKLNFVFMFLIRTASDFQLNALFWTAYVITFVSQIMIS